MIISPKYKYLFIGLPFSGSSAISKELIEQYDGESILMKHTNIPHLLRSTNLKIQDYFVFAVYRDPIEIAFTKYNKLKYNAKEIYTNPKYFVENRGHVNRRARAFYEQLNNHQLKLVG